MISQILIKKNLLLVLMVTAVPVDVFPIGESNFTGPIELQGRWSLSSLRKKNSSKPGHFYRQGCRGGKNF